MVCRTANANGWPAGESPISVGGHLSGWAATVSGLRESSWEDLALVDHWRRYLAEPWSYLRHLGDD